MLQWLAQCHPGAGNMAALAIACGIMQDAHDSRSDAVAGAQGNELPQAMRSCPVWIESVL